ncbi:hypothetical protein ACFU6S_06290 [Streptomyces sp. NPDC057456]|uniref:hypothetical protein n=1 Tax=Streptomyces sp. NPDC057456 TaxID=3346139 RepID=UPI003686563D
MRFLWLLLAILLTCLAIGGLLTAFERTDALSLASDLVLSLLVSLGAAAAWRRVRLPVQRQGDDDGLPWRR